MSNDRIAESFLQQWNANNKGIKADQFGILDVDSVEKYGQGSLFGDGQHSDRENQKKMFGKPRAQSECGANTHDSGKGFGKGNTCATGGKATAKPSAKSRQEMVDSGKNDDYFRMGGKDLKSAAEGGDDEAKAELNRRAEKKGRDLPYPEETPAEGETKNVSFTYNGKTINAEVSIGPNGGLIKLTDENFEEISTRGVTNEEAGNYLLQVRNRMSDYQEHEPDEYMIAGDDDPEADEELPEQRPWEGDDVTGGDDYVSGSDLVDTSGFKSAQGDELIAELWSEGETSEIHLYHSVDGKKTSVHSEYQMDPKEAAAQFDRIAKGDGAGMLKDLEAGQDDDPADEAPAEEAPADNDQPKEGQQYRLTGGPDDPSVAGGNSWEESKVDPEEGLPGKSDAPEEMPGATQEEASEAPALEEKPAQQGADADEMLAQVPDVASMDLENMTNEEMEEQTSVTFGGKTLKMVKEDNGELAVQLGGMRGWAKDTENAIRRYEEFAKSHAYEVEASDRRRIGREALIEQRQQKSEVVKNMSYDEVMESDDPRGVLSEYKRVDDPDYDYARKSVVGNFGDDVGDSARHKRNMYSDLDSVLSRPDADKVMTAKKILSFHPNNISDVIEHDPMMGIFAPIILNAFPGKLLGDKSSYGYGEEGKSKTVVGYINGEYVAVEQNTKEDQQKAYFKAVLDFQNWLDNEAATRDSGDSGHRTLARDARNWLNVRASKELRAGNAVLSETLDKGRTKVQNSVKTNSRTGLTKLGKLIKDSGLSNWSGVIDSRDNYEQAKGIAYSLAEGKPVTAAFGQSKSRGPREGAGTADRSHRYTDHAQRTGGPEATHGGDFQKAMTYLENEVKFRGLQWGNSVTDKERKHHATMLSDAMLDLADVTGMPLDQMSFGGKLAMAVGARGRGTAMAHYEPGYNTINLTRKNGIGSLAHEWGHAMDYLAGGGSPLTEGGTPYEGGGSVKAAIDKFNKACETSGFLDAVKNSASHKMNQKKGGDKAGYWTEPKEMFARSFESWVAEKLNSSGRANTYLTAGANVPTETSSGEYPTKAHMEVFSPIFEEVMDAYRKTKLQQDKPIKYSAEERHFLQERFLNLWSSI